MPEQATIDLVMQETGNSVRTTKCDYFLCTNSDCAHSGRTTKHTVAIDKGVCKYTCQVCGCVKIKRLSAKIDPVDPNKPFDSSNPT